jgi:hypothetical protein
LQKHFHHGSFAEQMLVPTENVFPLGPIEPEEAGRWCLLNLLLVPYCGLLAANFKAGETLLVSGATGNLRSSASEVIGQNIDATGWSKAVWSAYQPCRSATRCSRTRDQFR